METSSSECSLWDCLITRPLVVRVDECNPSGRSIITAKLSSLWIYKSDFTEHDHHHHHLFSFSYIHENISHSSLKNKYKLMRETEEAATNLSKQFKHKLLKKITCCIVGNLGCDQLQCKKKNKNTHTHKQGNGRLQTTHFGKQYLQKGFERLFVCLFVTRPSEPS